MLIVKASDSKFSLVHHRRLLDIPSRESGICWIYSVWESGVFNMLDNITNRFVQVGGMRVADIPSEESGICWIYVLCMGIWCLQYAGYTVRGIWYLLDILCVGIWCLQYAGYTVRGIWYLLDVLCVKIWCTAAYSQPANLH